MILNPVLLKLMIDTAHWPSVVSCQPFCSEKNFLKSPFPILTLVDSFFNLLKIFLYKCAHTRNRLRIHEIIRGNRKIITYFRRARKICQKPTKSYQGVRPETCFRHNDDCRWYQNTLSFKTLNLRENILTLFVCNMLVKMHFI